MNHIVVVERAFGEPTLVEFISEQARRVSGCLPQYQVTWLRTFASRDLRRMLCFYAAPDAEAVRTIQDRAGLPFERAWLGISISPPRPPEVPSGYATVIVEREIAHDVTEAAWRQRAESGAWCMAAHRVQLLESVFAPTQRRAVCVFIAPDAEAVRMANSQLGDQTLHAWPCTVRRAALFSPLPPRRREPAAGS